MGSENIFSPLTHCESDCALCNKLGALLLPSLGGLELTPFSNMDWTQRSEVSERY